MKNSSRISKRKYIGDFNQHPLVNNDIVGLIFRMASLFSPMYQYLLLHIIIIFFNPNDNRGRMHDRRRIMTIMDQVMSA